MCWNCNLRSQKKKDIVVRSFSMSIPRVWVSDHTWHRVRLATLRLGPPVLRWEAIGWASPTPPMSLSLGRGIRIIITDKFIHVWCLAPRKRHDYWLQFKRSLKACSLCFQRLWGYSEWRRCCCRSVWCFYLAGVASSLSPMRLIRIATPRGTCFIVIGSSLDTNCAPYRIYSFYKRTSFSWDTSKDKENRTSSS